MNLNLAMPWDDKCSPPQKPDLVFSSPQSDDLLFGRQAEIEIVCQAGLRCVGLKWTLARNLFLKPFRQGEAEALVPNRFRIRIPTARLCPGFHDLRVQLDTGKGKPVEGICTFGYRVAEMAVPETRPADFQAFWDAAKAKLARVPLAAEEGPVQTFKGKEIDEYNLKHACLPPDYDPAGHACEEVESCKVSFAGPGGVRVHGWLAKPKGKGPFPVMLVLPGGGFAARPRPLEHARHGYLALDIQVHGQDVDQGTYPRLAGYYEDFVFEPISSSYFYNVHLRCVQALNYLASRPDADASRIAAVGGSQGGRLSIVLAALDSRVKAIVPAIPNFANEPYRKWSEVCNKELKDGMESALPPPADTAESRCWAYYDLMNFAPDVHCAVLMNGGLIDTVSPPTGVWAIYGRLGSQDKQLVPLTGLAHDWSAEFDRRAWRWLDARLGIAPRQREGP